MLCVLFGETGSGKTDLAIEIANHFPITIISVDATMVYRGLDIGSAKPSKEILHKYPHKLVDILDIDQQYSVGQFFQDADREIKLALAKNTIPLLVGGSMMYFNAIENGISSFPQIEADLSKKIRQKFLPLETIDLYQQLSSVDFVTAQKLNCHDRQRIIRALEFFEAWQKPISSFQQKVTKFPYSFQNFAISFPKDELKKRLYMRVVKMIENGLIDEVAALKAKYPEIHSFASLKSVGYKETLAYLDGLIPTKQMLIEKIYFATCHLAKKQRTWFNKFTVHHLEPSSTMKMIQKISPFIHQLPKK